MQTTQLCRFCGKRLDATGDHERCARRFAQAKAEAAAGAAERFARSFPIASLGQDLPIEPLEVPMARQAKKPVPAPAAKVVELGVQPTLHQVQQIAAEYEMYKAEEERIGKELAKRGEFLKRALQTFPGERVAVGERILGRIVSVSESFNLDDAKKNKSIAKLLKPYTEIIEKFDLKAARKHIDDASLAKYVTAKETVSLRFLKPGGDGNGE